MKNGTEVGFCFFPNVPSSSLNIRLKSKRCILFSLLRFLVSSSVAEMSIVRIVIINIEKVPRRSQVRTPVVVIL